MVYAVFFAYLLTYLMLVRRHEFKSYNLSMILMFFCFALVPVVLYTIEIPAGYYKGWLHGVPIGGYDESTLVTAMLVSIFGMLVYSFSYGFFSFKKQSLFFFNYGDSRFYLFFGWFLFFLGSISFLIYLNSFGSLAAGFLANERLIYTGDYSSEVSSVSFLKTVAKLIVIGTYIIWGANKILNKKGGFLFFFPMVVSFLYLYYLSGRQSIIIFFAVFYFSAGYKYNNIYFSFRGISLFVFAIIFMVFGKPIFKYFIDGDSIIYSIDRVSDQGFFIVSFFDFIGEFSFPSRNLYYAIYNHSYLSFSYFKDLFLSFTYAFPERLIPSVQSTALINTRNIFGDHIEVASQPSDIFTYGFLNLSYLGVFFASLLFGFVTKWVDTFIFHIKNPVFNILFVNLTFVVSFRVMYFDPKHFIKGHFFFILVLFFLFFYEKTRQRRVA